MKNCQQALDLPLTPRLRTAIETRGGRLTGWQSLSGDGSDRRFIRLPGRERSLVLLHHPRPPGSPVTENDSYFFIGQHLRARGLPVPEIYTYCREEGWFLLEDLGDQNLQDAVAAQPGRDSVLAWYQQAVALLVRLQVEGRLGFSPAWCFDTPVYDRQLVLERECHYFVRAFLQGYLGWEGSFQELEAEFAYLAQHALVPSELYLLHRDFQSRNLMFRDGRLWLIDFQGCRLGPLPYDLAALLIDPYVALPGEWQEQLLTSYLEILQNHIPVDADAWRAQYFYLALCRNLQILGAYGFLTRVKGKSFFARFIPPALASLRNRLAQSPGSAFPRLRHLVEQALTLIR